MQEILDGLLAFFSAVGIVAVVFIVIHCRPRKRNAVPVDSFLLLYIQENGIPLSSANVHLCCHGVSRYTRIIVVDTGLTPEGTKSVSAFLRRNPNVLICTPDRLAEHLPSASIPPSSP